MTTNTIDQEVSLEIKEGEFDTLLDSVKVMINERNNYKLAFETVMLYLHDWSVAHNDGSLSLGLTMDASDLGEDNVDAFMLIENWSFLDEETRLPKEYSFEEN